MTITLKEIVIIQYNLPKSFFFRNELPSLLTQLSIESGLVNEANSALDYIHQYIPSESDARNSSLAKRITREGQRRFREKLSQYYGMKCLISGCKVFQVIEASHINPYRGKKDNDKENGLLLRRDLHSLFDADLLGIHPESLKIYLHPYLKNSEYKNLENLSLNFDGSRLTPSKIALKIRWGLFQKRLLWKTRF